MQGNPYTQYFHAEWYVGFGLANLTTIWHRLFARAPWEHTFAFTYDGRSKNWILFEPAGDRTLISCVDGPMIDHVVALTAETNGRIIRAKSKPMSEQGGPPFLPGCIYCVTQVNRLLGSPVRAFTPKGLHDGLLAAGIAQPAFKELFDG